MKKYGVLFLVFIILSACAAPEVKKNDPPEQVSTNFTFTPKEKLSKKHGIVIGIVNPEWGKDSFKYNEAFSLKETEDLIKPSMAATKGNLPSNVRDLMVRFTNSVGKSYEGMLLARGFDTMGPFKNIDDMTYPQKQACNIVIIPKFEMSIDASVTESMVDTVSGGANISSTLSLVAYEPLSKEKLWMKNIDFNSAQFEYKYLYRFENLYQKDKFSPIGYRRLGIVWDNRAPRLASQLNVFYGEIMNTSWNYFSPEEMVVLKKHSDDIREKKRF